MLDLHCHSTCSDGTDEPEELARLASAAGLRALALTDHDTVAGFDRLADACAGTRVRPIRSAEISCLEEGRSTHVLCYFISGDPSSALRALLDSLGGDRVRRNALLLDRLHELGFDRITVAELARTAGGDVGSLGRPHFAEALLRCYPDRFGSRQAVFDELLGTNGAAYVHKARVSVAQASAAARADGALTSLAHPMISWFAETGPADPAAVARRLGEVFARLARDGLTGVECYYPRHDPATTQLLVSLAREHGLVPTGGSDYHGANKPGLALGTGNGDLEVPDALLDELEARRGS